MLDTYQVRLDIFEYFGSSISRSSRVGTFLAAYRTCSRHGLKRALTKDVVEAIAKALKEASGDNTEEEDAWQDGVRKELKAYNEMLSQGLIRTMTLYNSDEGREERYTYLTGQANKLYHFMEDYSRTDLKETKDTNIHESVVNAEILASKRESIIDYAYALEAIEKSMYGLIEHMSEYNSEFTDFIEKIGRGFADRNKISETMHELMSSYYMREFNSFTNNAMPFRAAINKVAKDLRKILADKGKFKTVVEARTELLKKQGIDEINLEEIQKETEEKISGICDMCVHDYGYYMTEINKCVTEILSRIRVVVDSFSADGHGRARAKLLKMLRWCEETNSQVPEGLMDAYECKYAGEWSLKPRAALPQRLEDQEDLIEYQDPEEPPDTDENSDLQYQMKYLEYLKKNFPLSKKVNLKDLPCSTADTFYFILCALLDAGEDDEPERKELYILEEESTNIPYINEDGFMLPDIVVQRREPKVPA